jgi:hypothetical protein
MKKFSPQESLRNDLDIKVIVKDTNISREVAISPMYICDFCKHRESMTKCLKCSWDLFNSEFEFDECDKDCGGCEAEEV